MGVVAAAATSLLLAACSGSDGDAVDTAAVVTPPATDPPTTAPPTTTEPPTTTAAPTTTFDPADQLAAEVEADLLEAFRLGREAEKDPFDSEKERAALGRRLGVIAENLAAALADYRSQNYALRPNPDVAASVLVESRPIFLGDGEVAEVQICEVNSWVLVEVGAGPNGADAIVNPDVLASRSVVFMRNVDGVWKFEGGNELQRWEGSTTCPAG